MNLVALIAQVPFAAYIALIVSVVIPAISAFVVKEHWDASITGFATVALSAADGFFTEWAKDGSSFNWRVGLAIAIGSWFIASLAQSRIFAGTGLESWLLSIGSKLDFDLADDHPGDEPSDPTLALSPQDLTEDATPAGQVAADSQIAAPPSP